jgi:hypothetical protein
MPIDIFAYPPRSNNPFEIARRKLISALAAIKAPTIGSWPTPDDFGAVKDHIAEVAALADIWLRSVGQEIESNAHINVNTKLFESAFSDATEGWCEFECQRLADDLREEGV